MPDIWNATISIAPDVLHQELGGETVLLNLASESYFGLDEVGTRVWQLLSETTSASALVDSLLAEYEVGAEQLRNDVERIVVELAEAGLISLEASA